MNFCMTALHSGDITSIMHMSHCKFRQGRMPTSSIAFESSSANTSNVLVTCNTVQQHTVTSFPIVIKNIVIFIAVITLMTETQHHAWVVCAAAYPQRGCGPGAWALVLPLPPASPGPTHLT